MPEHEPAQLREHLDKIEAMVNALQSDMRRVMFCLLGDIEKNEGCGLLSAHAERGKQFAAAQETIADQGRRLDSLDNDRRWVRAYAAGFALALMALFFIVDRYVSVPKVDLNPKITQKP